MMKYRLPITIACAALMASGLAVAGEIYKWTDEDGNVHYEDRPVGKTDMEHVDVVSRNTDNTVVQARVDADRAARAASRQVASEAPAEMTKEELAETPHTPASLEEALDSLDRDHAFLLKDDVFTEDLIRTWIDYKTANEVNELKLRPHPYEFFLYYDN